MLFMGRYDEAIDILAERFGHDTLLSVATIDGDQPAVRIVNSLYQDGAFYTITHGLSNKMRQIHVNPHVAICSEWFMAHGYGKNLGHIRAEQNVMLAATLREAFDSWYSNGHTDETDPNTCILSIQLTDGVLYNHGTRYDLDFINKKA
jgi:general stress protein 26